MIEWIPGRNDVVMLRTSSGEKIDSQLPEMGTSVLLLWHDGRVVSGSREIGYEKDCGWIWDTTGGQFIAGHPLITAWQPMP